MKSRRLKMIMWLLLRGVYMQKKSLKCQTKVSEKYTVQYTLTQDGVFCCCCHVRTLSLSFTYCHFSGKTKE